MCVFFCALVMDVAPSLSGCDCSGFVCLGEGEKGEKKRRVFQSLWIWIMSELNLQTHDVAALNAPYCFILENRVSNTSTLKGAHRREFGKVAL